MDGNKRLASLATKVFLVINGQALEATVDAEEHVMVDIVAGHAPLHSIASWLQEHSSKSPWPYLPIEEIST